MRVLGIDPSLSSTGIAYGPAGEFNGRDSWTIDTEAKDPERLAHIYNGVCVAATHLDGCDLAVVEDLPMHAKSAGLTGMAQGVIRLALIEAQVPYVTVPAATLKKFATGKGNATKADMRMAYYQRADVDIRDDNECDALWLCEMGLHLLGYPKVIALPKANLAALDKVTLPQGVRA